VNPRIAEKLFDALFEEQGRNYRFAMTLSAIIIAINYGQIAVGNVELGGIALRIQDATVVVGGLGLALIYSLLVTLRFSIWIRPIMAQLARHDEENLEPLTALGKHWISIVLLVAQCVIVALALLVALPSIGRLALFALASGFGVWFQ
jgi:hypothetical protein